MACAWRGSNFARGEFQLRIDSNWCFKRRIDAELMPRPKKRIEWIYTKTVIQKRSRPEATTTNLAIGKRQQVEQGETAHGGNDYIVEEPDDQATIDLLTLRTLLLWGEWLWLLNIKGQFGHRWK